MTIDLAALKTELTTDPAGLGYTGDDRADAKLLNDPTKGRKAAKIVLSKDLMAYLATRTNGSGDQLRYVLDMLNEYGESGTVRGASASETGPEVRRSGARMICTVLKAPDSQFDVSNSAVAGAFTRLGDDNGNGPLILDSTTLQGIAALATELGTRSLELYNEAATPSDCANARRVA
jgi:hypothetical protein